jgi:hypothetical protein
LGGNSSLIEIAACDLATPALRIDCNFATGIDPRYIATVAKCEQFRNAAVALCRIVKSLRADWFDSEGQPLLLCAFAAPRNNESITRRPQLFMAISAKENDCG